jgi:hypothetical protein
MMRQGPPIFAAIVDCIFIAMRALWRDTDHRCLIHPQPAPTATHAHAAFIFEIAIASCVPVKLMLADIGNE